MKKLNILIIITLLAIFLCSCSNEQGSLTNNNNKDVKESTESDLNSGANDESKNYDNNESNNTFLNDKTVIDEDTIVNSVESLYDYEKIYSFHEISENEVDFVELTSFLQPKGIDLSNSEYDVNTHTLRIYYDMNLTKEGQVYNFNYQKEAQDSMVLFTVLEYLKQIIFDYRQIGYYSAESSYNISNIEEIFETNISEYRTKESFTDKLPLIINELDYKPDLMSFVTYEHAMGLDE